MKAIFVIPKRPPPVLEGNYTKAFKEFVTCCLQKDPDARPTAKELLKHRFLKTARKPSFLHERVEKYLTFKQSNKNPLLEEDEIQP
jgi:serine/threonine-protein kinase 24/25/MST4